MIKKSSIVLATFSTLVVCALARAGPALGPHAAALAARARPCDDNGDCGGNQYCAKEAGDCDGSGACTRRPRICPLVYNPVCGCDGNTYGNACEAARAGVNVDHPGECDPVGKCCTEVDGCQNLTEHECAAACGAWAGPGTSCSGHFDCPIPPIIVAACCLPGGGCIETTECLCGNQGGTWGGTADCGEPGACGEQCGGFAGIPCSDPNDFCKTAPGECCCDFFGTCTPIPFACPLIWAPVCGCDGQTYGNECFADSNAVSVDHAGTCEGGPGEGDCTTNADCVQPPFSLFGQYCAKALGDCDGTGTCQATPQLCLDVYQPVCGCDGNTYSNDCYANRAGVNVASEGECPF